MAIAEAIQALKDCEARIRKLLADAAAGGNYEDVRRMASLAEAVSHLANGRADSASKAPIRSPISSRDGGKTRRATAKRTGRTSKRLARKPGSGYPRFYRRQQDLIKIGWSKRQKNEYQHKAPRGVFDLVVSVLGSIGAQKEMFTSEDLLPVADPDGNEVPAYQVYICLAFLRSVNLVEQHGRQGYSVVDTDSFSERASTEWNSLPILSARR
jgi:hypothetical protein